MAAMTKNRFNTITSKLIRWRMLVQTGFLVLWLMPLRIFVMCGPVYHCHACPLALTACPIGIIANFGALHVFPFVAVGVLLVVGGLVGTFICGWVCPFGFLQDLLDKVPTRKFKLPVWIGYFRYVVLAVTVIAVPFFLGEEHWLFICRICPAGAIEGALPNVLQQALTGQQVIWPSALKLTIAGLLLVTALFKYRPWCTLFCPLGAIYSLFNRFSLFFLRFHPDRCTSCNLCHKECKVGLKPDEHANDSRCIRCLDCTECGALTVSTRLADAAAEQNADTSVSR